MYVGDYVLLGYGTGAVMGVPAHDERDFDFAKKHGLSIRSSISPLTTSDSDFPSLTCSFDLNKDKIWNLDPKIFNIERSPNIIWTSSTSRIISKRKNMLLEDLLSIWIEWDLKIFKNEYWFIVNCEDFFYKNRYLVEKFFSKKYKFESEENFTDFVENFLENPQTIDAIEIFQIWLTEQGLGGKKTNYKIQDWVFSRQRYWGEPFPIIFSEGKTIALDESDLPLLLPDVDHYEPTGTEEGPLAEVGEWVNTTTADGKPARRETNTMPGWAGSSWYWLRYMDPRNNDAFVWKDAEAYWQNVDTYVGGAEHVTRHIIYARFWQKFLYDLGMVSKDEPFQRYQKVGLIMAEDGRKMSKRRGNVINPDDVIAEYGADVLRTYEMFMGPFDQAIAWNTQGMKGVKKFLDKIIALWDKVDLKKEDENPEIETLVHQTIKKLTVEIDEFKFNTSISQLMILVNKLGEQDQISRPTFENLVLMFSPFAPHLAEEFWERLGNDFSIFTKGSWPKFDEKKLISSIITLPVQINGKMRGTLQVSPNASQDEILDLIRQDEKLVSYLTGEIKKCILVPGKIINIIV